jgi:hypothetical protein
MSHSDDFGAPALEESTPELETYFGNVVEFVDLWLLPHYARNPKQFRWSPQWWEYTEVVGRLEALWRAWEHYRLEGMTGMAVFFNDYMDPTMRTITSADGPFWNLGNLDHPGVPEPWASAPPPAEFFNHS